MPNLKMITLLTASMLLLSCSGIAVKQDYEVNTNFAALKTYKWQSAEQKESTDARINNSLLNDRIRNAIDTTLAANGFIKASGAEADFAVGYHYLIHHRIDTNEVHTFYGFGIGRPYGYGAYGLYTPAMGTQIQSRDYGEIIVDITDKVNGKLIWRGSATQKLYYSDDPRVKTQQVNQTITAILAKFPPNRAQL